MLFRSVDDERDVNEPRPGGDVGKVGHPQLIGPRGRELAIHVKAVLGTAQNPMTRAQVDEKCFHLMAPILGKARARKLCDAVWDIEKIGDARKLRPLLTA